MLFTTYKTQMHLKLQINQFDIVLTDTFIY